MENMMKVAKKQLSILKKRKLKKEHDVTEQELINVELLIIIRIKENELNKMNNILK